MTTFNYQGMEYDESYIKKHMLYSANVNRLYMTRVLKEYFGARFTDRAQRKLELVEHLMWSFRDEPDQETIDAIVEITTEFRQELEWTKLDEEAIRYLGIKAFTELDEEDRDRLNMLWRDLAI
jgi:hypothetical protein|nr:MAG TPA: hypothetical protein [Caudoviricetes sp.]